MISKVVFLTIICLVISLDVVADSSVVVEPTIVYYVEHFEDQPANFVAELRGPDGHPILNGEGNPALRFEFKTQEELQNIHFLLSQKKGGKLDVKKIDDGWSVWRWAPDSGSYPYKWNLKYAFDSNVPTSQWGALGGALNKIMLLVPGGVFFSPTGNLLEKRTLAVRKSTLPNGMLGRTYYSSPPNIEPSAGDVEIDIDQMANKGLDVGKLAVHEMSHGMGIGHINVKNTVMYPYYNNANSSFRYEDGLAYFRHGYTPIQGYLPACAPFCYSY